MAATRLGVFLVSLYIVSLASGIGNGNGGSSQGSITFNSSLPQVNIKRVSFEDNVATEERGVREGKGLLDLIGFGTGPDTDPYLAKANAACLDGDLSECFKSRALSTLDEFFGKEVYTLTDNARIVRMPVSQLRYLHRDPYEFSTASRSDEPEWDQFVKFMLRKVERFMKSAAIEVQFPNEVTEQGRYSPRFIDEIASEIDILEDKNESAFSRTKLKKLFIPLLVILKLFKLKLLLFLPLILGLASFKKLLGFLALVVPGLIGFFKLCKPDLHHNYGSYGHSNYYHQPPHHPHQYSSSGIGNGQIYGSGNSPYYGSAYSRDADAHASASQGTVTFKDLNAEGSSYDAHNLAYQAYQQYQSS